MDFLNTFPKIINEHPVYFLINQINKKKSREHFFEAYLTSYAANYSHGSIDEHHNLLHGFCDFSAKGGCFQIMSLCSNPEIENIVLSTMKGTSTK